MTPSSIEGLMGLWEEHLPSLFPLKGTRLDDSPREWFSEPPVCPSNERCIPEPMAGTMRREPSPFQSGEEVRSAPFYAAGRAKRGNSFTTPFSELKSFSGMLFYAQVR